MSRNIYNRDKGQYGLYAHKQHGCMCKDTHTPEPIKILKKIHEAPDIWTFRLDTNMNPQPGQFVQCSVLGVGEAPISVSSNDDKYLELTIKSIGRVTKELCKLKPGDSMHVRGPYGNAYPMHHFTGNDLVIVCAGTALAPIRGVVQFIRQNRERYGSVHLYVGFRNPEDILFKKEILGWEKDFGMCLSISHAPKEYQGSIGHCTDALWHSRMTNTNKIAIVCGPPMMMNQTIMILRSLGFNDDQIWFSQERHMKCATGTCGHCMINGNYTCKDGPVFRLDKIGITRE